MECSDVAHAAFKAKALVSHITRVSPSHSAGGLAMCADLVSLDAWTFGQALWSTL